MVPPTGSLPTELSFEALLWREVGLHLDLQESIQRIYAIIAEHVPIFALSVRRLEPNPARLITLAVGADDASIAERLWPTHHDLDESKSEALTRFLAQEQATLVTERDTPLAAVLMSEAVEGPVLAVPLYVNQKAMGLCLLQLEDQPHQAMSLLQRIAPASLPLRAAFENDCRLAELARMRAALEADREALLSRLARHDLADVVVGAAQGLSPVMERVSQVAWTSAPVLILGETGSGKEVIARAIHARSSRVKGPIVRINCGAIPSELVDSELFGHERGAFTGATSTRKGWFERADGGTLFLDEIGELPPAAQVRLLRVLQDGTLERVGGHQTIAVDVRIVAATHRDLHGMVAEGSFREDLWYRLSVFPIQLPALRHHMEDLPALAGHFAERAGKRLGGAGLIPTSRDLELLNAYGWPGNVRELAAVIERAAILGNGKSLQVQAALGLGTSRSSPPVSPQLEVPSRARPSQSTPFNGGPGRGASAAPEEDALGAEGSVQEALARESKEPIATIDEVVAVHIRRSLKACHGRIEGPFGAAKALGINPHTLRARMRKLGIAWAQFRTPAETSETEPVSSVRR